MSSITAGGAFDHRTTAADLFHCLVAGRGAAIFLAVGDIVWPYFGVCRYRFCDSEYFDHATRIIPLSQGEYTF